MRRPNGDVEFFGPKIVSRLLHKLIAIAWRVMRVTAHERRSVLKLFNVSEAARRLGVGIQRLHRDVRAGRVPSPRVRLGWRLYFTPDDLCELSAHYEDGRNKTRQR